MERSFAPYVARLGLTWHARFGADAAWAEVDGSLVKVDLSGFTRLSERLARSSRTGAEELNAVLNDVFGDLIGLGLARGGDVLQFGGDALLIWYEGEDHRQRAAAATWAQQRAVMARPAEQTPAGPVRLRMSAGIASGRYGFVVAGESHRELFVVGDAATRTTRFEHEAHAGQVLVDEQTAMGLEPGFALAHGTGTWRLRRAPRRDPLLAPDGPPTGDGERFVPPEVLEVERAGIPAGEHRRAAVAFVRLGGLDALVAEAGVGAAAEAIDRVTRAIEAARARHDVCWSATDLADDSAVFLLFAGTPVAREGDDERMLRAARAVLDECVGLPVRIGVNSGRVFAADIGHAERRTFASIGDTVNLAARLMARTPDGTVQASRAVVDRAGATHDLEWLAPFHVKGKRAEIEAALVGSPRSGAIRQRTHDLPLVGRDDERRRMAGLLAAVVGGSGAVVSLVGPAGSGKSRLLTAMRADATTAGVGVVDSGASIHERSTPYAAVRRALRSLVGLADVPDGDAAESLDAVQERIEAMLGDEARFAPLLGLPLGIDWPPTPAVERLDPAFVAARRDDLLRSVLTTVVGGAPRVLVVEDVHWADQASLGLVGSLAAQPIAGLGVVLTSREPVDAVPAEHQITLTPLSSTEARRLVLVAAGEHALSDLEIERLVAEGQGNPLFLRELCAFRSEVHGELPETADEVISARIDTLAPRDRSLLRDTAVVGFTAAFDVLADALDDPSVVTASRWTGLAEFVHVLEGRDVQFRHDLYRRSAYAGLAARRRRALHGKVADHLLGSGAPAATVAVHLHDAGRYGEAVGWAMRAADEARRQGALADAAALYERAIDSARRGVTDRGELAVALEARADIDNVLGRYAAARAGYREARRRAPHRAEAVSVKLAGVLERMGEYRTALRELTRAERSSDAGVRCDALLRRSSVHHCAGAYQRARATGEAALIAAEALADRHRHALALLRLEMAADDAGDPDRLAIGEAALAAFEGLDDDHNAANVNTNVGLAMFKQGDWDRAVALYRRAAAAYRRMGDVMYAAIVANNLAELHLEQGRLGEALDEFTEIHRVFRAGGHAFGALCTAASLGTIHARLGAPEDARRWLEQAHDGFADIGSRALLFDITLRRVEAALLAGDRAQAHDLRADAARQRSHLEDVGVLDLTAARLGALARAADGDRTGARSALLHVADQARQLPSAWELAQCLHAVTALDEAEGRAADATHVAERDTVPAGLGITRFPPLPAF